MRYITEAEYEARMKKIQRRNASKERKRKLKEEGDKYRKKRKFPTTSKLVLLVVFLLCIEIIAFCEYAMIVLSDAGAMYVLIGVPTTLVPTIIAYYNKAKVENTTGGITYDMAMFGQGQQVVERNGDSGLDPTETQG